jgi:hypothetical protein
MFRYATENNEMKQEINHILTGNLTGHQHGETFPGILINDIQYPESSPVIGADEYEIITPDVVLMLRPKSNAGTIIEP